MSSDGDIPEADYKQVFEETCMSIIEGLVLHARKAKIKDADFFMKKWISYYWRESE